MPATHNTLVNVMQAIRKWAGADEADGLSDQDLVRRFVAARDETAFACLVRRQGPMVLGVCRKMLRHEQDAEDAFQATFLVLARKARTLRGQESVGGWLYSVAFRVANKLRRARNRRQAREHPLRDETLAASAEDLSWREVQIALYAELERLPAKYRAPLVSCYVQGQTRDEAAQHLGCKLDVLRGRLDRGRELLRTRLARRGLSLSAALLAQGMAGKASAASFVPPLLFSATIQAVKCTAGTTAAAGVVSAQVAALTQGVIQAMFLSKLKSLAVVLVTLAVFSTGVGLVSYHSLAQDSPLPGAQDAAQPTRKGSGAANPRNLQEEIQRLRRELEQLRADLQAVQRENALLKARAEAERDLAAAAVRALDLQRKSGVEGFPAVLDKSNQGDAIKVVPPQPSPGRPGRNGDKAPPAVTLPSRPGPADKAPPVTLPPRQGDNVDKLPPGPEAVSPDGRRRAVAQDKSILIFDSQTGRQVAQSVGHQGTVSALAFSPDGKILASGSADHSICLWDTATFKQLRKFLLPNAVSGVRFSADGRMLTATEGDGSQREFDIATGVEARVIRGN